MDGTARTLPARAGIGANRPAAAPPQPMMKRINTWLLHPAAKPAVFVMCLVPFALLLWGAFADQLGANPAEAVIRRTGDWTLRFLCITLAVTPLRTIAGWPALARLRRMLGLYAFFYAAWHFLAFAWLDMGFDLAAIVKDIGKRPFILVGTLAFVLLMPLAATSFNRAIRALGAARWQALHRTVYGIVLLGLLHFFWMRAGKNDFAEWSVYAAIVALLLRWRVVRALRTSRAKRSPAGARRPSLTS